MNMFRVSLLTLVLLATASFSAWVNVTGTLSGMATGCGNIYCVAAVPSQNKVILGISGGVGFYASTDYGNSWQPLGSSTGWVYAQSVVFDKDNPNTFWETGIHGGQVHKTVDGGATFSIIAGVSGGDGIGVDMSDPMRKTIVVGTH